MREPSSLLLFVRLEREETGRVNFLKKLLQKFCKRILSFWSHQSEQPHSLLLGQSECRRETGSRRLRQRKRKSFMESKGVLGRSARARSLACSWPPPLLLFFFFFFFSSIFYCSPPFLLLHPLFTLVKPLFSSLPLECGRRERVSEKKK